MRDPLASDLLLFWLLRPNIPIATPADVWSWQVSGVVVILSRNNRTCGLYAYWVDSSPPSQPPGYSSGQPNGQPAGLIPGSPVGPIWLRPEAGHGETVPGIVLGWNRDHIRSALDSGWVLTVAVIPFDGALLIDYAKAERVVPVRDATPVDPTASTTPKHQRQFCVAGVVVVAAPAEKRHLGLRRRPDPAARIDHGMETSP